jgi:hypothetical protein
MDEKPGLDQKRDLLRHTLAALAYRASRALDGAPDSFAGFAGAGRMPVQILAHMGDLLEWALTAAVGKERWHASQPQKWRDEKQRFFQSLGALDAFLASGGEMKAPIEKLMQGPVLDAFTHVGQLAMLRRLSGSPTKGENFVAAAIAVGQVKADQPAAVQPFK